MYMLHMDLYGFTGSIKPWNVEDQSPFFNYFIFFLFGSLLWFWQLLETDHESVNRDAVLACWVTVRFMMAKSLSESHDVNPKNKNKPVEATAFILLSKDKPGIEAKFIDWSIEDNLYRWRNASQGNTQRRRVHFFLSLNGRDIAIGEHSENEQFVDINMFNSDPKILFWKVVK